MASRCPSSDGRSQSGFFPSTDGQSPRIWSAVEKRQETGSYRCPTGSREIDSSPNSLPGKLELPSALKVESGALLTMGQRSRSQHRFSLVWSYNAHRGVALLLLKGSQRIIVINVPWCLSSSERVSPPTC